MFYAFWQGALVCFFGFYSMENVDNSTGWSRGLVVDGEFVFMGVVFLVNIKILTNTSNYNFYPFFFSLGSILVFLVFFFLMNLTPIFSDIYKTFNSIFVDFISYFSLFFMGSAVILIDNGIHLARRQIKLLIELRETEESKRLMKLIQSDKAI